MSETNFEDTTDLDLEDELDGDLDADDDLGTNGAASADGEDSDSTDEEAVEVPLDDDDEDEETEQSLDVLLVRDQPDVAAPKNGDRLTTEAAGIGSDEFTCRSCFLVKKRAQLVDEDALICFDCA